MHALFYIVAAVFIHNVMSACPNQRNITTVDGYRFWRVDTKENFGDATSGCSSLYDATLALIKSDEISEALHTIISGCEDNFYFGLRHFGTDWYWQDTEGAILSPNESRWDAGEGDDSGSDCACVNSEDKLCWIDEPCTEFHSYVCQKDLLSVSSVDILWSFVNETVIISVAIESVDGAVNINVYKNDDYSNAIDTVNDVSEFPFTYTIEKVSVEDNGTYTFVVTDERYGYSRSTSTNVFVQDRVSIISTIPMEVTSPVTRVPRNITCVSKGIPTPTTSWFRNGVQVRETEEDSGVYQRLSDFTAVLHIDGAISSDDGIYSCVAKHMIRDYVSGIVVEIETSDIKKTSLRVFGSPIIIDVALVSCTNEATIKVTWKANNQTLGINHVIEAKNSTIETGAVSPRNETTSSNENVSTVIPGLTTNISYIITVTVCPDDCIESLQDSTTFFGEFTNPVSDAKVTETGESEIFCEVVWSFSDTRFSDDMITFKIKETSTLVSLRNASDPQQATDIKEVKATDGFYYKALPNANSNYIFDVYASNCAGDSAMARAEGNCSTGVSGATQTESLSIDPVSNDTINQRTIAIPIPSEVNGPISCLFVVVRPGGGDISTVENLNELAILSKTASNSLSSPTDGTEYIAVAIPMYQVYDQDNFVVVLGDNQQSSCDVFEIYEQNTRAQSVYGGYNWELIEEMEYGVYVVSTTPAESGDVYFGQSNATEFVQKVQDTTGTDDSWVWILLVAIGSIIMAVAIGGIVYYAISWKKAARNKKSEDDPYERVDYANGHASTNSAITTTTAMPFANKSRPLSPTAIIVANLPATYRTCSEQNGEKCSAEFENLKYKTELINKTADVGSSDGVKKKNRYKNVLPYDHSRVCLIVGGGGSDIGSYINASYINGFERPKKFIATQGPLAATVEDFWKIVMQENSKVIVMVTNLAENAKQICECYWPESSAPQIYGNVKVSKESEHKIGGCMKREFKISDRFSSHSVVQFQMLNWPDHGVPVCTSTFHRLYKACIDAQGNDTAPIIVHCSAGAGRTGTFIAYDYLIQQASKENVVDIFECVLNMRSQRMDMVQNCNQYLFIYRLLAEFHIFKDTDVDSNAFYTMPSLHSPATNELQNHLKILDLAASFPRITPDKVSFLLNLSAAWRPEDDETIPRFDAVRVETYEDTFHLIASAPPTKSTAEIFWRLNLDNNVTYVVSIDDPTMQSEDDINECWPSEDSIKREFGSLTVELNVAEEKRHFHIRDLVVRRDASVQTKEIRHFKILKWRPKVAINVIKDLKKSCELSSGSKIPRVLVHCRRGFGESGSFCALINLMARLETEQRVDVLRTVKDLKDANIELVENAKQYKFCYDALKCFDPSRGRLNTRNKKYSLNNSAYDNAPMTTTL